MYAYVDCRYIPLLVFLLVSFPGWDSPIGALSNIRPIVAATDSDECGVVGRRICKGNGSTLSKPVPVPHPT
jgi:hypothetical protein